MKTLECKSLGNEDTYLVPLKNVTYFRYWQTPEDATPRSYVQVSGMTKELWTGYDLATLKSLCNQCG